MPIGYVDALALAFGDAPFTVGEFSARLASLRPAQTLSELKTRGLVARVGRGRYRLLPPGERPDLRAAEWSRVRSSLLTSGLPMRWAGNEAVALWTGWRYTVAPSMFLRVFEIEVPKSALGAWKGYLRRSHIVTNPRRRTGGLVRVIPRADFEVSIHRGEPVMSRNETLQLIRAHRAIYAEADKLVERKR